MLLNIDDNMKASIVAAVGVGVVVLATQKDIIDDVFFMVVGGKMLQKGTESAKMSNDHQFLKLPQMNHNFMTNTHLFKNGNSGQKVIVK